MARHQALHVDTAKSTKRRLPLQTQVLCRENTPRLLDDVNHGYELFGIAMPTAFTPTHLPGFSVRVDWSLLLISWIASLHPKLSVVEHS